MREIFIVLLTIFLIAILMEHRSKNRLKIYNTFSENLKYAQHASFWFVVALISACGCVSTALTVLTKD